MENLSDNNIGMSQLYTIFGSFLKCRRLFTLKQNLAYDWLAVTLHQARVVESKPLFERGSSTPTVAD